MKLIRWALAGASVYVVYRYTIGRAGKGEDVFVKPDCDDNGTPQSTCESAGLPRRASKS